MRLITKLQALVRQNNCHKPGSVTTLWDSVGFVQKPGQLHLVSHMNKHFYPTLEDLMMFALCTVLPDIMILLHINSRFKITCYFVTDLQTETRTKGTQRSFRELGLRAEGS